MGSIGSRVVYELDHKNPILYVIPIQSILGKLLVVPVGDTGQSHTTCATTFRARLATAGRVLATDAVCGLSIRGHLVGPVICNETGRAVYTTWRKVPCECGSKAPFFGALSSPL